MSDQVTLPRVSKGKRPVVFDDPSVDHLVTMCLELATELYTVHGRLTSLERLLERDGVLDRAALNDYRPDEQDEAERAAWRELFLDRLFRTIKADQG